MNALLSERSPVRFLILKAIRVPVAGLALAVFLLAFTSRVAAVDPPPTARTFDSLTVGDMTYTRVTIIDISRQRVSFRSAQGFATVRLSDLDATVQARLAGAPPPETSGVSSSERAVVPSNGKAKRATKVHARTPGNAAESDEESDDDDDDAVAAPSHPKIQWTVRNMVAVGILGLGALALCIGRIWFICAGFKTSVLWGLWLIFGSLLADIMFCVGHWDAARRPTFIQMGSLALVFGGWKVLVL